MRPSALGAVCRLSASVVLTLGCSPAPPPATHSFAELYATVIAPGLGVHVDAVAMLVIGDVPEAPATWRRGLAFSTPIDVDLPHLWVAPRGGARRGLTTRLLWVDDDQSSSSGACPSASCRIVIVPMSLTKTSLRE